MAKNKKADISPETQQEALLIAKKTQKPGQTKEQTRLIALGIQKGIAEYKKSAKNKQRQADKAKKKQQQIKPETEQHEKQAPVRQKTKNSAILPWSLLIISWLGFAAYLFAQI
ncbi:MAG: DUF2956 domain-containing protein [Psychromonas sp.]|nr:DUF2956 domain-containing protein [Psychromonas sp.]